MQDSKGGQSGPLDDDPERFKRLWAPWRLAYVTADRRSESPPDDAAAGAGAGPLLPDGDLDCFVCRAVQARADRENLIVYRGRQMVTILNRYPYNNGHLLVAPRVHLGDLGDLDDSARQECLGVLVKMTRLLESLLRPDGFNIGLNLGRVAGAGLPGHLHWHVVPRWNGDTNFMATLAGTRVMPQSLEALWEMLTEALSETGQP